ncbi:BlaI/MecI/CopY family transcriptional regulator [Daejeonella sp.]|uniref:BlaI/MecI/CopY family transcriptional regulator n=1 Tax=Daejeonella sp. TaxID=2805397 RepID=UPI00272F2118|nr:BlaI/MecI/CopY family transcriptional regulator [Daejeonella sp.]MDP2414156.1 BlaI/MecI/CopY family transcriptional regulator [Daejeonella sp.]
MKRLSEKEEAVMRAVWKLDKAFAKEVREEMPEPKPHINTIATMMKRLVDKGFLKFEDFGATYRYYAALTKKEYTTLYIRPFLSKLFGGSIKDVVAFFAEEEEISVEELKEVIKMIEDKEK